ncbi:unnamed protein product [Bemisia tabaci]|uniref:Uncharacterized protein n=1 Tax=Bemisia tabaci TaxID=7038 RepID=A0A9P0ANC5_BEMTA|nr:unnamed protein product [Bemisia tabaci]
MAFIHGEEDIARVLVKRGGILSAVEALHSSRKKGKLKTLIDLLRIDTKLYMRPVIFEAFSSHTSSLVSFILMLEYPVAVSVVSAMGNSLRDSPCSLDVLLKVLGTRVSEFASNIIPEKLQILYSFSSAATSTFGIRI